MKPVSFVAIIIAKIIIYLYIKKYAKRIFIFLTEKENVREKTLFFRKIALLHFT